MNCKKHHDDIDQHRIEREYMTEARANGPMRFWLKASPDQAYEER
jgi:hypothetical protein